MSHESAAEQEINTVTGGGHATCNGTRSNPYPNRSGVGGQTPAFKMRGKSRCLFFFFFSSRRRHTRFDCDWSSDVCSSDLMQAARLLGAERIIAVDRIRERLLLAHEWSGAEMVDYSEVDMLPAIRDLTGGQGPDRCIDAVGMEAHGYGLDALYDRAKVKLKLETDRPTALREVLQACRKGGTVSIPGVYGGVLDKVNLGAAFCKGLTLELGQTHVQRYMEPLLHRIEAGEIDATRVISHRLTLDDAPAAYRMFRDKEDGCTKVVMRPGLH